MRKTTNPLRRNVAVLAAAAVVGGLGIGGVVSAHADSPGPQAPGHSQVQQSDGDGEQPDATEVEGAEETNDGPDQGPDANPNEPGHQDADESGEAGAADGETNDDAADSGPDANPNEPGHQDAADVQ